jgi:hypothetical protein
LAKLVTPFANGIVGYGSPPFTQELFAITEAQTEAAGKPDGGADNLHRKAVLRIFGAGGRGVHALMTSYHTAASQASQEINNVETLDKELDQLNEKAIAKGRSQLNGYRRTIEDLHADNKLTELLQRCVNDGKLNIEYDIETYEFCPMPDEDIDAMLADQAKQSGSTSDE